METHSFSYALQRCEVHGMNRGPFNVRRSPSPALHLLRNGANTIQRTATQASQRFASALGEPDDIGLGKKRDDAPEITIEDGSAATMSYALPQSGATQRHTDQWSRVGQDGHGEGGISEKVNNMFNPERRDSLPMYKDKPFGYPGSSKRLPWFRRKRTVGLILGTMAALSWYFGVLSPLSYMSGEKTSKSASSWSWFGSSKSNVDWDERAQNVREAFQLSWAGYEKYGWGKCTRILVELLSFRSSCLQATDRLR